MYNINDKSAAIRDIQKYLSKIYEGELKLNENGIFDEKTLRALNRFQGENELEIKDSVDFATFSSVLDAYLDALLKSEAQGRNPNIKFPLSRGMQGSEIYRLNAMLRDILEYYSFFELPPLTNYYSEQTENAAKDLCIIFGMDQHTEIDGIMYAKIEKELRAVYTIISDKNEYFPE